MAYSLDFRRKVLSVREREGLSFNDVSKRFDVGIASVVRWSKEIFRKKGVPRKVRKIDLSLLAKDIEEFPDAYQYERAARFGVCEKAIWSALRRLGVSVKKSLVHPKADAAKQQCFQKRISAHQKAGHPIVYIDESGFAQDMPRTHGYSPKGQRCYGVCDWNTRKGRVNAIGALLGSVLLSISLTTGTVNGDLFHEWLRQDLLPKLPPKTVLVMDNATFHKRKDTKKIIEDAEHILEFLPPYSPQLNPIEHKWAQAKSIRRKMLCNTHDLFKKYLL